MPKPLPKDKFLGVTKLKAFADYKFNVSKMSIFLFDIAENIVRRECWFPAFSPFPKVFSNCSFFRVVKSWDCVVKLTISLLHVYVD